MLKLFFEYLTSPYSLVENPLYDWALLGVLGYFALFIAFRIVGWLYHEDIISGSGIGSILHWTIRFFVFAVLHYIVATAIKIYTWITNVPVYVWWCVIGFIAGGIVLFVVWFHTRKKRVLAEAKNN